MKRIALFLVVTSAWAFAENGVSRNRTSVSGTKNADATTLETSRSEGAHDAKNVNFRVSPLPLLFGMIQTDVEIRVSDKLTVGPTLAYVSLSTSSSTATAYAIGARANLYLTGVAIADSWYFSPSATVIPVSATSGSRSASLTALAFGATAGYQWVWDNGINLSLGFGARYYTLKDVVTYSDGSTTTIDGLSGFTPAADFSLGFAL